MKKITKLLFLFLLLSSSIFKPTYSFEYDGVEYFINQEEERIGAYTLELKGVPYSYTYTVIKENGTHYFPLFEFIKSLDIKNYKYNNGILNIIFGDNNDKRVINLKKMDKSSYIYEDNDFYLKEDLFKEYFFEELRIDEENFTIKTKPNFILPNELNQMLKNKEKELKEELDKEVLAYKGERKLFDIGNLRIELDKEIIKRDKESGRENDWSGRLEYSGSLLFGNFTTDYDLKDKKFGDFEISYHDVKEDYELNLGIYGDKREKGFSFRKDRGYSQTGREYTIEERVPIGSKVELIYNFFPIDIQYEKNGKVKFENNLIKTGREFTLRVYEPDGTIRDKIVKINDDYNQQIKGEFGYDLYFREDKESKRNNADMNLYYGYTDNLTLGFSFNTEPQLFNDDYIYSKSIGTEFIYSNSINGNPYTFNYAYEKSVNKQKNEEVNFKQKYRHKFMFDTDIDKFSFNYEQYVNGKYFDEKREIYIDADYDLTENLSLTGSVEQLKYFGKDVDDKTDYYYGLEYSKSWRSLLVSYEIENHKIKQVRHNLDFYYTGFRNFTVRLENSFNEEHKFESELKLNNTRWLDRFDISIGAKYSEEEKVEYMLEFTLKFDNWFEFGSSYEKDGDKRVYAGIDRVVSLKNPTKNMNSLENTTIKAIAFLDKNDNNIMDEDEERVEGVEISLGQKKIITNEQGIGKIYGIPSYTEYELEAKSQRPSHDGHATKIKVKGLGSSEVKAYIPIKPLVTFMGKIDFKDESVFEDIRIKLNKVNSSRMNKIIYPESNGELYIDSLIPGKYNLEIDYTGDDYNIPIHKEEINLLYTDENAGDNYYHLELKENKK